LFYYIVRVKQKGGLEEEAAAGNEGVGFSDLADECADLSGGGVIGLSGILGMESRQVLAKATT
jgi:hypothetical protein